MKSFEGSMGWTFPDLNLNEFSTSLSETPELSRLSSIIIELNKKIDEKDAQIELLNNNVNEMGQAITELAYKLDAEIENAKNDVRGIAPNLIDHVKYISAEISKKIIDKEISLNESALLSIIDKIIETKLSSVSRKIILNTKYYNLIRKDKFKNYKNIDFIEDAQLSSNEIFCTDGTKTVKFDIDALISSYMDQS